MVCKTWFLYRKTSKTSLNWKWSNTSFFKKRRSCIFTECLGIYAFPKNEITYYFEVYFIFHLFSYFFRLTFFFFFFFKKKQTMYHILFTIYFLHLFPLNFVFQIQKNKSNQIQISEREKNQKSIFFHSQAIN